MKMGLPHPHDGYTGEEQIMKTQEKRWSMRVGILVMAQVLLGLIACELAFAIVDGPTSGLHVAAALIITSVFMLSFFGFKVAVPQNNFGLDTRDLVALLLASVTGGFIASLLRLVLPPAAGLEMGPIVVASSIVVLFGVALRLMQSEFSRHASERRPDTERTIVVGSGRAAASLVRLIQENHNFKYSVVGCVDDEILSERVSSKPILGTIDDLPELVSRHRIACVIIAIPFASAQLVKRIINKCVGGGGFEGKLPAVKILPGVLELLNDGVRVSRIRPVQPEDLLPRDPVKVDLAEIAPHVENRVILVTGAGGSIGSELCRQIVGLNPSLLLLLGHGENSLFAIDEELRLRFGFHRTKIILADVADAARIRNVFSKYNPHVVFHAAAHKHVPIVEANMCEAVRNNVLGTHVVALAAAAAGAAKFVLLFTDKAVNPTSVMGATKRLSEIISQSFVNQTGTEFVTVRFGNVLESRGSVIPIFKKQIEAGGPVTITHRDMQRYFMTIPEAVSLVLEGMAIGRDGQVLVLDMGKPVNILKLAETLITLSGLTPYRDIDIVETGIRPGEKLFEEILTNQEGLSTTSHARLFIAQQERVAYETLALGLRALEAGSRTGDERVIVDVLRNFVPSYQPGSHLFVEATNGKVTHDVAPLDLAPHNGRASGDKNGRADRHVAVDSQHVRANEESQPAGAVSS
jgi:FlaA1/EpsC-like NDP-sugar epimerase